MQQGVKEQLWGGYAQEKDGNTKEVNTEKEDKLQYTYKN